MGNELCGNRNSTAGWGGSERGCPSAILTQHSPRKSAAASQRQKDFVSDVFF